MHSTICAETVHLYGILNIASYHMIYGPLP